MKRRERNSTCLICSKILWRKLTGEQYVFRLTPEWLLPLDPHLALDTLTRFCSPPSIESFLSSHFFITLSLGKKIPIAFMILIFSFSKAKKYARGEIWTLNIIIKTISWITSFYVCLSMRAYFYMRVYQDDLPTFWSILLRRNSYFTSHVIVIHMVYLKTSGWGPPLRAAWEEIVCTSPSSQKI